MLYMDCFDPAQSPPNSIQGNPLLFQQFLAKLFNQARLAKETNRSVVIFQIITGAVEVKLKFPVDAEKFENTFRYGSRLESVLRFYNI